jgi:hypothetical protein
MKHITVKYLADLQELIDSYGENANVIDVIYWEVVKKWNGWNCF